MSAAAQLDLHDNRRSREVSKVALGEQAPRPAHEYGTVSKPPPPPSSSVSSAQTNRQTNFEDSRNCAGGDEDDKDNKVPAEEGGKRT